MKVKRNIYESRNNNNYFSSHSEGIILEEISEKDEIIGLGQANSISPGVIFAIVSPWRPNLAGRIAAQAVRLFSETKGETAAYIGASKDSTGAIWLDMSDEELMISDWRVPGSRYPIEQGNIKIFPVDPSKNLAIKNDDDFLQIIKQLVKEQSYTVIDFAGDIMLVEKIIKEKRLVVLVILPGVDPVEYKTSLYWFNNIKMDKENIIAGIDIRGSAEKITDNSIDVKIVIKNSPADALLNALKAKVNDSRTFIWV
ncbi:MAG: hypothetical protein HGA27_07920 [Peptococcaceae bacterium]|nr:hypothetical protein [Peptococcaceae bacterium]